jgi:phosphoribosylformylglycinamidine synthase
MGDACRVLGTPVTGGNVSLYNEHPEGAIHPTPTVGMLGVVDDLETQPTTAALQRAGDVLFLLTPGGWCHSDSIGASEYLSFCHDRTTGDAPHLDLDEEIAVQAATRALIKTGIVQHAHDISDGGLAVCLAESAIHSENLGLDVDLPDAADTRLDATLFGEAQSRVVLSVRPDDVNELEATLADHSAVSAHRLGTVTDDASVRLAVGGSPVIETDRATLATPYASAIPDAVGS